MGRVEGSYAAESRMEHATEVTAEPQQPPVAAASCAPSAAAATAAAAAAADAAAGARAAAGGTNRAALGPTNGLPLGAPPPPMEPRMLTPMGWLHKVVRQRWRGRFWVDVWDLLPTPLHLDDDDDAAAVAAAGGGGAADGAGATPQNAGAGAPIPPPASAEATPASAGGDGPAQATALPVADRRETSVFCLEEPQVDEQGEPRWEGCKLAVVAHIISTPPLLNHTNASPARTPPGSAPVSRPSSAAPCCPTAASARWRAVGRCSPRWGRRGATRSRPPQGWCRTGLWRPVCGTPPHWRGRTPQTSDWCVEAAALGCGSPKPAEHQPNLPSPAPSRASPTATACSRGCGPTTTPWWRWTLS